MTFEEWYAEVKRLSLEARMTWDHRDEDDTHFVKHTARRMFKDGFTAREYVFGMEEEPCQS